MSESTRSDVSSASKAWSMVGLGFVAQAVAYGFTFGMAGTFIEPATEAFSASRASTSLGPSLVALLHGLLGPVVGLWLARHSVRPVLWTGALLMAGAFGVMHVAQDIWTFSLAYGLLGGAAVSCLGVTPVTALVTRWFPERHGRALGIAFMPMLVMLLPPLAGYLNVHYGWRTTALLTAFAALALVPLFALVREPAGGRAAPVALAHGAVTTGSAAGSTDRFRPDAAFWLLAAAVGVFDGSAITMITHVIPYATETGIDYQKATLLISVMGLCGLAGAPLLGMLADRIGGASTLALVAVLLALGWTPYLFDPPFLVLAAAMALLGFCGGAFAALLSTALASRYHGAALGSRGRDGRPRRIAVQFPPAVAGRLSARRDRGIPRDLRLPDRDVRVRVRDALGGHAQGCRRLALIRATRSRGPGARVERYVQPPEQRKTVVGVRRGSL